MKQIIYFSTNWCTACQAMSPAIDQLQRLRLAEVARINTDYDASNTERYNISSIPTIVLLENGNESKRYTGVMNIDQLKNWVNG